jgi:hypothetical protein
MRGPLLRALILGLIAFAGLTPASPRLEASNGFNDFHRPGEWTPVRVVLENLPRADRQDPLRSYEGQVEVTAGGQGSASPPVTYAHPVSLAPNDRKVLWIYAKFSSDQNEARVRFTAGSEEIAGADMKIRPLAPTESLVVHVRSGQNDVSIPSLSREGQNLISHIDADLIPPGWQGLTPADLIIIPRITEQLLSGDRPAAIRDYVRMGGNLLGSYGRWTSSWQDTKLEELLPAAAVGPKPYRIQGGELVEQDGATTSSPAKDIILLSPVKPRAESRVALSLKGMPLLVVRTEGNGTVALWCGDWNTDLFQLVHLPRIIAGWLATRSSFDVLRNQINDRFLYINQLGLIGGGAASSLPSIGMVFFLLLGYFLLIGPLNFVVLWKLRKLEWAWITIPAVVITFSVALLIAGGVLRGGKVIHRSFEFITTSSGQPFGRADVLALHFTSSQGRGTLAKNEGPAAQSAHVVWNRTDQAIQVSRVLQRQGLGSSQAGQTSEFRVVSEQNRTWLEQLPLRQWDSVFYGLEQVVELPGGSVRVSARLDGRDLTVDVTNGTNRTLQNPALVIGDRKWRLSKGLPPQGSLTETFQYAEHETLMGREYVERPFAEPSSISDVAKSVLATCLMEPDYVENGAFPVTAYMLCELSRPVTDLPHPETPSDESAFSYLMVETPLSIVTAPATHQWFGPRPLSDGLMNYGRRQRESLDLFNVRADAPVVMAIRGFMSAQTGSPYPGVLHLRLPSTGAPQVSPLVAQGLSASTGRWMEVLMESPRKPIPIAIRASLQTTFVPQNNDLDWLIQLPDTMLHPITGGAVIRLESGRNLRMIGPIQRLNTPEQSVDSSGNQILTSDSD